MSFGRQFSRFGSDSGSGGPSDDMLAMDAATEYRSFSLIYDRYADRLYRALLAGTGDPETAHQLLDDLISTLPSQLKRYAPAEHHSFHGWLFSLAARRLDSGSGRLRAHLSGVRYFVRRTINRRSDSEADVPELDQGLSQLLSELSGLPPTEREVLAIHLAGGLTARQSSEALSMPTSLVSHHLGLALKELSGILGSNRIDLMQERFVAAFQELRLSEDDRQRHRRSVARQYQVEEYVEAPAGSMRRDAAIIVLVALLGIGGLYTWERAANWYEDRSQEPDETVQIATQPDQTPVSTPTATPVPEPTPTPTEVAEEDFETLGACDEIYSRLALSRFEVNFHLGNFLAIRSMIPGEDSGHRYLDVHPEGQPRFVHGDEEFLTRDEFVDFLEERFAQNEQWDTGQIVSASRFRDYQEAAPMEMYQAWREQNPGLDVLILPAMTRKADDIGEQLVQARVIVDCNENELLSWSMLPIVGPEPEPLPLDDIREGLSPLGENESRQIDLRVVTDQRLDGGLLKQWNVSLLQANAGNEQLLQRVDVLLQDDHRIIQYVDHGDRWWLVQRGWQMQGWNETPELPAEIDMVVSWLGVLAELLDVNADRVDARDGTLTVRYDFSLTAGPGTEVFFEVEIEDYELVEARLLRITRDGEYRMPALRFVDVSRDSEYAADDFAARYDARGVAEFAPDVSRFQFPEDFSSELQLLERTPVDRQDRETYRISWKGVEIDLTVMPSRGGLDVNSVPRGGDPSWRTEVATYSYGQFVWAHRHFAGYPTEAYWDNGRFRFEIAVDRETVNQQSNWNLSTLTELIEMLSGS